MAVFFIVLFVIFYFDCDTWVEYGKEDPVEEVKEDDKKKDDDKEKDKKEKDEENNKKD